MKKILFSLFVFASVIAYGQKTKIAHVSALEILQELASKDSVSFQLEQLQRQLLADLQKEEANLQRDYQEYINKMDSIAPPMRQVREESLKRRQAELQQKPQQYEILLQQHKEKLTQPLRDTLTNTIKKIAKAGKYTYVLETTSILYADGGIDLSNQVRKALGLPEKKADTVTAGK